MKVFELKNGVRRPRFEYYLSREEAEDTMRAYNMENTKRRTITEINAGASKLSAGHVITEDDVTPELLGHIIAFDDDVQIIRGVVTCICTTYPNIGMTIKPLEPSRDYFNDPFEPISFGIRTGVWLPATFVE